MIQVLASHPVSECRVHVTALLELLGQGLVQSLLTLGAEGQPLALVGNTGHVASGVVRQSAPTHSTHILLCLEHTLVGHFQGVSSRLHLGSRANLLAQAAGVNFHVNCVVELLSCLGLTEVIGNAPHHTQALVAEGFVVGAYGHHSVTHKLALPLRLAERSRNPATGAAHGVLHQNAGHCL